MRSADSMSVRGPKAGPGSLPHAQRVENGPPQGWEAGVPRGDGLGDCGENLQSELPWTERELGERCRRRSTLVTLIAERSAHSQGYSFGRLPPRGRGPGGMLRPVRAQQRQRAGRRGASGGAEGRCPGLARSTVAPVHLRGAAAFLPSPPAWELGFRGALLPPPGCARRPRAPRELLRRREPQGWGGACGLLPAAIPSLVSDSAAQARPL